MNIHAEKTTEAKSNAAANNMALQQDTEQETFQLKDDRPATIAQRKVQQAISNGEQVKQLKEVKSLANNSPRVQELRAVQSLADDSFVNATQFKELNTEELIRKQADQTRVENNLKPGVVQRAWTAKNNGNLTEHPGEKEALEALVDGVSRIPTQIKTIMPKTGSTDNRIDMQGSVRRGGFLYANIQFQVGGDSVAGIICPFDLDINLVKAGLREALEADDVLEWEDEETEVPSSPHMDNLFEAAENANLDIDSFQEVFDEAITELKPDMIRIYTSDEQYVEEAGEDEEGEEEKQRDVTKAMEKISLNMCLAQFTAGHVAEEGHHDLYSEEKWKQKFKIFARDYIKQELVSELPLQDERNSHYV
jgi:hypothetical protein